MPRAADIMPTASHCICKTCCDVQGQDRAVAAVRQNSAYEYGTCTQAVLCTHPAYEVELVKTVLRVGCPIIPPQLILFCELQSTQGFAGSQRASYSRFLSGKSDARATVLTGREAGLPSAMGPPPPLRVAILLLDAITRRDKPARDAGRSAIRWVCDKGSPT